tara:strand:+ start:3564 stop:3884 length:321 start_codon:yes stop_codon:yes gene_type:complete
MIPFIRSLSELMAITEAREIRNDLPQKDEDYNSIMDSGQKKRYSRSLDKKNIDLPDLPKKIRNNLMKRKESLSKFVNELDYNNQIQSSYDLTLLETQNIRNDRDAA